MSLKERLSRRLPARVEKIARASWHRLLQGRLLAKIVGHSMVDGWRFFRWSHDGRRDRHVEQRQNAIIKAYHGIEKGLSLAEPRSGFGQAKVRMLMKKLDAFMARQPASAPIMAAIASLQEYQRFNADCGLFLPWLDTWLEGAIQRARPSINPVGHIGGTIKVTKAEINAAVFGVRPEFFLSRHSIRQFGSLKVPQADIEKAVRLAQKAPSACNRQGPRVHCFSDPMTALSHQPGNAGFGHLASQALVVTSDLQAFCSSGERHQAYVDGGIFAMALVNALHALGYGSCMLAWNSSPYAESNVKHDLGISRSEVIIMMIAVGTLPDDFRVAVSARRPLDTVLHVH